MLDWMRNRGARVTARPVAIADSVVAAAEYKGEYRLLYHYLRDRYASRVVLTFAEIEDLLGFPLPAPARLQREWWSDADPSARRPMPSDSWISASRTAVVNLLSQSVVFDRTTRTESRGRH